MSKSRAIDSKDPRIATFIAEYVVNGGNGTKAMQKASPELTEGSAATMAGRLLKKVEVQQAIEKALRAQVQRTEIKGDRVLKELYRILTVDIADAFEENGALKPLKDIPEDVRRAISGIEVDEIWDTEYEEGKPHKVQIGETKKLKFWSKTEAAQLLGRNLKLWLDKLGVAGEFESPNGEKFAFTLEIRT